MWVWYKFPANVILNRWMVKIYFRQADWKESKNGFWTVFSAVFSPDFSSFRPKSRRNRVVFLLLKQDLGRHLAEWTGQSVRKQYHLSFVFSLFLTNRKSWTSWEARKRNRTGIMYGTGDSRSVNETSSVANRYLPTCFPAVRRPYDRPNCHHDRPNPNYDRANHLLCPSSFSIRTVVISPNPNYDRANHLLCPSSFSIRTVVISMMSVLAPTTTVLLLFMSEKCLFSKENPLLRRILGRFSVTFFLVRKWLEVENRRPMQDWMNW